MAAMMTSTVIPAYFDSPPKTRSPRRTLAPLMGEAQWWGSRRAILVSSRLGFVTQG